jgi:hypothetical protein
MNKNIFRRDFLKGLATVPFLGYFAFSYRDSIDHTKFRVPGPVWFLKF